jgi:tRNA pseudouridine38-40 synthase
LSDTASSQPLAEGLVSLQPLTEGLVSLQPADARAASQHRLALGITYRGQDYLGWQSQPNGRTVQDALQRALHAFATLPMQTTSAGRTDAGVHAVQQVVHVDTPLQREPVSWVRGTNRYLPRDIAVQWCVPVTPQFHARASARARTYRYLCLESPVRPSLDAGLVGWVFRPLDETAMRQAAQHLIGEHDFTSFRSSQCQAPSPIKTLTRISITRRGRCWCFEFEGTAFLHHMVRNIMGMLVAVGQGLRPPASMLVALQARSRDAAAPTFAADGLYFLGPTYDAAHGLPPVPTDQPWPPSAFSGAQDSTWTANQGGTADAGDDPDRHA